MVELPKRRRGRPTKEEAEARKIAETQAAEVEAKSPDGISAEYLDRILSESRALRKTAKLHPDEDTLRRLFELAKIGCTQEEASAVLGCTRRTLSSFLSDFEVARDAWDDGFAHCKISLRRKQLALADKNAPAAIFLGKNILGQKDENTVNHTHKTDIAELSDEQLMELATRGRLKRSAEDQVKDKTLN
jgi:hypothetical protein